MYFEGFKHTLYRRCAAKVLPYKKGIKTKYLVFIPVHDFFGQYENVYALDDLIYYFDEKRNKHIAYKKTQAD